MTSNGVAHVFKSAWWSINLPPGWTGIEEKECVTFRGSPSLGILQVSSARKDKGPVTDQDLREFAQSTAASNIQLHRVSYSRFSGFYAQYQKGSLFWKEWWLRSGQLMLYATYNMLQDKKELEEPIIEKIICSLQPIE
jgi:hypothetical protein